MKPLHVPDGTVEALKWIALALMTGDHVNKYLFNGTLPFLFEAGRLALPLFVFVLGYNLARPGAFERGAYTRTMKRLAVFGAVASVPFIAGPSARPLAAVSLFAVILARKPALAVLSGAKGPALIPVLGATGRVQLVFGVLFAVGLWLGA